MSPRDRPEYLFGMGRCFLCGSPCIACRSDVEVCGDCIAIVFRAHEVESRGAQGSRCPRRQGCPGWMPVQPQADGSRHIVSCGGCSRFGDDEAAALHVADLVDRTAVAPAAAYPVRVSVDVLARAAPVRRFVERMVDELRDRGQEASQRAIARAVAEAFDLYEERGGEPAVLSDVVAEVVGHA